ncbi:MAG: hypothetical protein J6X03_03910 [Bacilli bacterium]|nr:hypothetical protein [Bacilli bacterium]
MKRPFSSFILRTIALVSMTFDHVAKMMAVFLPPSETLSTIYTIFNIIGRLAFPIYLFLIIEGFVFTKDYKKYLIRMGAMAGIIFVGFVGASFIVEDISSFLLYLGNIFLDLTLYLVFFYFLFNKNKLLKPLALLPLGYNVLVLLIQNGTIYINNPLAINFISGLLTQYSVLNIFIMPLFPIVFCLFTFLKNKITKTEEPSYELKESNFNTRMYVFAIIVLIVGLLCYLFTYYPQINRHIDYALQTYMLISIAFILLYNGSKGYSNKFIQIAYYLYYPLHLVIIFLIVYLFTL